MEVIHAADWLGVELQPFRDRIDKLAVIIGIVIIGFGFVDERIAVPIFRDIGIDPGESIFFGVLFPLCPEVTYEIGGVLKIMITVGSVARIGFALHPAHGFDDWLHAGILG